MPCISTTSLISIKNLEESVPSYLFPVTTSQAMVDWIIAHILQSYKKPGRYLKATSWRLFSAQTSDVILSGTMSA